MRALMHYTHKKYSQSVDNKDDCDEKQMCLITFMQRKGVNMRVLLLST